MKTTTTQEEKIFELAQDGAVKFRGAENSCFHKLHTMQSNSSDWAMKYEKWTVREITAEITEEEKATIIDSDPFWPVVVTLIDPFQSYPNRYIKVRLEDGTETTANTYAMRPQEGGGVGTTAIVKRSYISNK
tara:strand:- start:443 stop:838 length:396 start_codon:yes stop_codon:yes gene_type:complete